MAMHGPGTLGAAQSDALVQPPLPPVPPPVPAPPVPVPLEELPVELAGETVDDPPPPPLALVSPPTVNALEHAAGRAAAIEKREIASQGTWDRGRIRKSSRVRGGGDATHGS